MLLTDASVKWKGTVFILMFVIILFGSISYISLPRESTPEIKIPVVMISTVYTGVSPEDIELLVTLPLERKLKGLKGIKEIKSYSSESVSNISIEFEPDVNVDIAFQKVKDKVDLAMPDLPEDLTVEPVVMEISTSDFPVMVVGLSADISEWELKKIADDLKDDIERIKGVLEVKLSGARDREISVEFDYDRLISYNLSIKDIGNAIKGENINIPGGSMDIGNGKYLLRIPGEFKMVSQIEEILITTRDGQPIYLKDLARVYDTFTDRESYARLNGVNAISLSITKRTGENIIQMSKDVKNVLTKAEEALPPIVKISLITDMSRDINNMVHELENHLVTGLILVIIVLFFFLGTLNSIFTALAIPFSMLMSFIVFEALGITLNMVVLFSLIMALGMLVDDAIVIVENIYRHMQGGKSRKDATIEAGREVGWPIIAATLTKICAFLPMIFWPGVMGDFMKYIPLTLMITLLSSLFVALVFNPVICSTFMSIDNKKVNDDKLDTGKFMEYYIKTINLALKHRKASILIAVAFMILPIIIFIMMNLGIELDSKIDPKQIYIRANAPQGTGADTTNEFVLAIEKAASGEGDIKMVLGEVGGSSADYSDAGGSTTHLGRVTLEYKDFAERLESSTVVTNRIRERLGIFPGADIIIEKQDMGPPTGPPINIEITGDNFETLGKIAMDIKNIISEIPGIVDLKDDYIKANPEIRIDIDREKAVLLGISTGIIGMEVRNAISGYEAGKFRDGDEEFDIKVRLPKDKRSSIEDILNMNIALPAGGYIPLSSVANIIVTSGFGKITRKDFGQVVIVSSEVEGRNPMQVLAEVVEKLKDYNMPKGYAINYTGEREDQKATVDFLSKTFILAIFLILMVLMVEFNSFFQTAIILGTVLLSIGGVFWGLVITNSSFNVMMSGIGVISLAGVVVNNGIIMIDYTNKLVNRGYSIVDAVVHAGVVRFRPVLLTAVTAILGMLPMATGYGINVRTLSIEHGAEMAQYWGPMAEAIIFGLTFATAITLIIVPVLYSFIDKEGSKNSK